MSPVPIGGRRRCRLNGLCADPSVPGCPQPGGIDRTPGRWPEETMLRDLSLTVSGVSARVSVGGLRHLDVGSRPPSEGG